jgi:hypothetical protein
MMVGGGWIDHLVLLLVLILHIVAALMMSDVWFGERKNNGLVGMGSSEFECYYVCDGSSDITVLLHSVREASTNIFRLPDTAQLVLELITTLCFIPELLIMMRT